MQRTFTFAFAALFFGFAILGGPSHALAAKPKKEKPSSEKGAEKAKPELVGTFGDWSVFVTRGDKNKTCYALAQPRERLPAALKRDPAYIFISTRQAENVKNEVSIILGFAAKDGSVTSADIGDESFEVLGKGGNAWVKNPAEEPKFVATLRKGSKLVVKMPSLKGNMTIDTYSLTGLTPALDRVAKECL